MAVELSNMDRIFDLMAGSVSLTQILVPLVSGQFLELSMTCGCQTYDRKVRCGFLFFTFLNEDWRSSDVVRSLSYRYFFTDCQCRFRQVAMASSRCRKSNQFLFVY